MATPGGGSHGCMLTGPPARGSGKRPAGRCRSAWPPGGRLPAPSLTLNVIIRVRLKARLGQVCVFLSLPAFTRGSGTGPRRSGVTPTQCGSPCVRVAPGAQGLRGGLRPRVLKFTHGLPRGAERGDVPRARPCPSRSVSRDNSLCSPASPHPSETWARSSRPPTPGPRVGAQ